LVLLLGLAQGSQPGVPVSLEGIGNEPIRGIHLHGAMPCLAEHLLRYALRPPLLKSLAFKWPARSPANANNYLRLPTSPLEQPAIVASLFEPGERPNALLVKGVGAAGFGIFRDELLDLPSSPVRVSNLNLDADRGNKGECWTPKPGTSINDDPVSPLVLAYQDI
jgi:hypothetical protein